MQAKVRTSWKEIVLVYLVCVGAIAFRMWFITLAPQPFGYDQYEYESYTTKMVAHPLLLASHSYRSYPFPLMLAILYKFVGFGNHEAVFVLHALLDSLAGLFVYMILRYGVGRKDAAWLGLIIYTLNPFTSGYVGVLLAEVLTTFSVIGTLAAGVVYLIRPRWYTGLVIGFFAGLAAETRNAAFIWAAIPIVLFAFWVPVRRNVLGYIGILVGLFITVAYPAYVNWRDYKEFNITTVDSFYAKEFFQGVYLTRLPPFTYVYPVESQIMWSEYYSEYDPKRTTAGRRAMAKKYYDKAWELIKKNPTDYIKVRFEKMWYVWQKENLFFYQEPNYKSHKWITYTVNLLLLGFAIVGLSVGKTLFAKTQRGIWVWWVAVGTIVYATVGFSVTHAEYRLTIPFYPVLIVCASVGGIWLWRIVKSIKISSQ